MTTSLERWYLRLTLITVVILYTVVLAGSVVRATGSGMGCPDWPKCFGQFIPPTDVSQITPEYLAAHPEVKLEEVNIAKTWTEFINRVIGKFSGWALIATLIVSFRFVKKDVLTPVILVSAMILFGVVVWMGKVVVDETLKPRTVTIHMLGGLTLVMAAVAAATRVWLRLKQIPRVEIPVKLRRLLWISFGVVVFQVLLGTQMREAVDHLIKSGNCCEGRIENAFGNVYLLHRLLAAVAVFCTVPLFFILRFMPTRPLRGWNLSLGILIGASYLIGVLLVRWNLPAYLQPAHLVLATLLMGVFIVMLLSSKSAAPSAPPTRN